MRIRKQISEALQSGDEEIRREALQNLRQYPLSETRALLFTGMGDPSWRVRKEAVDMFVNGNPDDTSIGQLLELLRNEDNAGLRNSAAEAVIKLNLRSAPALIPLSRDKDPDVRKFVIDVMGAIGHPSFEATLVSSLQDDDMNVAAAAAEHLGRIGSSHAVPPLLNSIIATDSPLYRFSALAALGKMTSHVTVPPEIIRLADEDMLRKSVYECLGSIGDESACPILLAGFTVRQKSHRKAAVMAWHRIYSASDAPGRQHLEEKLNQHKKAGVLTALEEIFDPEDHRLAEAIIAILGLIGDLGAAPMLLSAFSGERHAAIALDALKRLGPAALNLLLSRYDDLDEQSRYGLCCLVGKLCHRSGAVTIQEALKDHSPRVRKAAVTAAGLLSLRQAIPDVVTLLNDATDEVRAAALACLQTLARTDRESIRQVAKQLSASDQPEQRRVAAALQGSLGDGNGLSLLIKDEHPAVRLAAVSAIGKLQLETHQTVLMIALSDEDPDVRIAAAEALGETGDREILKALVPILADDDQWVQCAALKSIKQLDHDAAISAIRNLLPQADGLLLITCLDLLEAIATAEAIGLVESALGSSDSDAVDSVMGILGRQGDDWIVGNAGRLLLHPSEKVRNAWVGVLAGLPTEKVRPFFETALAQEPSESVKQRLQALLDNHS